VKRNTRHSQQITEAENTGRRIPLRIQLFSLIICFLFCQSHFLPSLPNATPVVATVVPPPPAGPGVKKLRNDQMSAGSSAVSAQQFMFSSYSFCPPKRKQNKTPLFIFLFFFFPVRVCTIRHFM
jgi:hypothetical protein